MNVFLWGALSACSLIACILFLKFFTQTRDRLFAMFSAAFFMLALNWSVLGVLQPDNESRHFAYYFRLAAFVLILVGIVDKNRSQA
jgi:hypothetical protein